MIAVLTSQNAKRLIEQALDTPYKEWEIVGIVLADRNDMVDSIYFGNSCCM